MITKPPIPASAVSDQWIADCREALNQREGVPIRAHATEPMIETWAINLKRFLPQMLPGSGTTFVSMEDRDIVLRKLEGK